ncbi:hypothetical protein, partial [Enterobacter sp. PTB]
NGFAGCWREFQKRKVTDFGLPEIMDSIPSFDSRLTWMLPLTRAQSKDIQRLMVTWFCKHPVDISGVLH